MLEGGCLFSPDPKGDDAVSLASRAYALLTSALLYQKCPSACRWKWTKSLGFSLHPATRCLHNKAAGADSAVNQKTNREKA